MKITRIKNENFKTNETAVFLTIPLDRKTITQNALLPAVLRRGTVNLKTQLDIGKKLEEMYGTGFNCGIDKTGDYCILKFYIESLSNKFVPNNENISQEAINLLMEIVFNPLVINNGFNEEYVKQEKENLKKVLESRKDNKENYAYNRCIEELFKNEPYQIFKYGYIEDLEKINSHNLYEHYKEMIEKCKIHVIINGIDAEELKIPQIENKSEYETTKEKYHHKLLANPKVIKESLDVQQGKLIIGLDIPEENKYAGTMYNVILGGGANSKLFQNVREKASLAYYAGSSYLRRKNAIIIKTGIELQNYEKALDIIKLQLEEMKNGNITENEIKSGRELVLASLRMIKESQEDTIAFYYDQKLFDENLTVEEYMEKIEQVTKEQIIDVAEKVQINTIYYLKNFENA